MKTIILLILFFPIAVNAQLQLAKIFSDNIILQRDQPVHVWGKAAPGKQVEVSFAATKKTAIAKQDSTWIVLFQPQTPNPKPQTISIASGNEKRLLQNILIGDVWLCIGQSNMEWPMKQEMHFKEELPKSNQSLLRFYNPSYAGKDIYGKPFSDSVPHRLSAENFYQGKWQVSDSNNFQNMSAVGYYFGKEIIANTNIPIGLVNLSIGGAPIETFIRREAMQQHPQFAAKVKGNWLVNNNLPVWIRERGAQNVGANQNVFKEKFGANHAFKPGFAYGSGIAPIIHLPIKGIIFYQGESNAQEKERVNEYGELMKLMVDDYRKQWKQPVMPFYFVQLSSIDTVNYKGQLWPHFRNEQRKAMNIISHSGMVVTSDIGAKNDVHPTNKKEVGKRLAYWALNRNYKKNVLPSGPLPIKAEFVNGNVFVSFQYAGKGLQTSDGKTVKGFSLDGISETEARIQNKTIVIAAKKKPAHIYHGWKPYTDANLVNAEGLPASTFKIKVQ